MSDFSTHGGQLSDSFHPLKTNQNSVDRQENAFFWEYGQITNLGTLGGYESTGIVNNQGQVAGITTNTIPDPYSFIYSLFYGFSNGTQTRAFRWDRPDGMQDLGTLGGPDGQSFRVSDHRSVPLAASLLINERGEVAGTSYTRLNSIQERLVKARPQRELRKTDVTPFQRIPVF